MLLSSSAVRNRWCRQEIEYALTRAHQTPRSNIVPVIIGVCDLSLLPPELHNLQYFKLTGGPFDQRVEELIQSLKIRGMECPESPNRDANVIRMVAQAFSTARVQAQP